MFQYYATVKSEDDILWLSEENISEQKETDVTSSMEGMIGLADMVGSGHSVGGVVSSDMSIYGTVSILARYVLLLCLWGEMVCVCVYVCVCVCIYLCACMYMSLCTNIGVW